MQPSSGFLSCLRVKAMLDVTVHLKVFVFDRMYLVVEQPRETQQERDDNLSEKQFNKSKECFKSASIQINSENCLMHKLLLYYHYPTCAASKFNSSCSYMSGAISKCGVYTKSIESHENDLITTQTTFDRRRKIVLHATSILIRL